MWLSPQICSSLTSVLKMHIICLPNSFLFSFSTSSVFFPSLISFSTSSSLWASFFNVLASSAEICNSEPKWSIHKGKSAQYWINPCLHCLLGTQMPSSSRNFGRSLLPTHSCQIQIAHIPPVAHPSGFPLRRLSPWISDGLNKANAVRHMRIWWVHVSLFVKLTMGHYTHFFQDFSARHGSDKSPTSCSGLSSHHCPYFQVSTACEPRKTYLVFWDSCRQGSLCLNSGIKEQRHNLEGVSKHIRNDFELDGKVSCQVFVEYVGE